MKKYSKYDEDEKFLKVFQQTKNLDLILSVKKWLISMKNQGGNFIYIGEILKFIDSIMEGRNEQREK